MYNKCTTTLLFCTFWRQEAKGICRDGIMLWMSTVLVKSSFAFLYSTVHEAGYTVKWSNLLIAVDQKRHFTMSFSPACGSVHSVGTACSCNIRECVPRPMNVLALCWKNQMHIYRNPGLLFFQFLLPTIQVALFCLAVGRNLEGINVAYVDADKGERKLHCPGVVMSWCTICTS